MDCVPGPPVQPEGWRGSFRVRLGWLRAPQVPSHSVSEEQVPGKVPGDDCPLVWGQCSHCFHMHCILKWLNAQQVQQHCPMCRQEWKFKE
ncbi:anaphase-promoting complex subunit 11 isoform X1 [Callorhinus ursinus]|uniref:anaphase-promoting complex subunit 11 isoform X1 n=1 Tax=Callorhinus ursinus TaxID=34884 RepID=UPI003CD04030